MKGDHHHFLRTRLWAGLANPYLQGRQARRDGEPEASCPYDDPAYIGFERWTGDLRNRRVWEAWHLGWQEGDGEIPVEVER